MKKKIFAVVLIFTMTVTSFTAIAEKIDSDRLLYLPHGTEDAKDRD